MRILITNDDGINAPGLKVMHEIALNRPLEPYFTKTQLKNKIESWENIFQ